MRGAWAFGLAAAVGMLWGTSTGVATGPYGPARLVAAYPDAIAAVEGNDLVWKDGSRMPIDDGKGPKPYLADAEFEALLNAPDIDDQFYLPYQPGDAGFPPARNADPGRVRYEPLFRKLYGDCRKGEVEPRLEKVEWLPRHRGGAVMVTRTNGVAEALRKVSAELDALPDEMIKYLTPSAGTYNCRAIAGTDRMSMHAYGASIDINTKFTHYWRWTKPQADGSYPYRNRIPLEIVEVFERHGFIWGGKWYHYDTMHFEYRPELLPPG